MFGLSLVSLAVGFVAGGLCTVAVPAIFKFFSETKSKL